MKKQTSHTATAWTRLARVARDAPALDNGMPFGFSTRVVAAWSSQPQAATWEMMEWFTWRALALALIVTLGSAALSYDGLSKVLANETAQAGAFIDDLINL